MIKHFLSEIVCTEFSSVDLIAGVATAGIAHGALLADNLKLPYAYVRSKAKSHGLENLIEGKVSGNENVVVIEDLISTGGSSLAAVNALRESGCQVLGLLAIFSYGFEEANKNFQKNACKYLTLSSYPALIENAIETKFIQQNQREKLLNWYKNPREWSDSQI